MVRLRRSVELAACVTVALAAPAPAQPINRSETTAVVFAPDGKTLFSSALDNQIRTWDSTGGRRLEREAHKEGVYALALSPDGKLLATAGGDERVRLWNAATLEPIRAFEGHQKEVFAVAFSPDGKTLASGGADKSIRLWEVATGKPLRRFHGHELRVTGLAFSPDGKTLASAGSESAVVPGFFAGAVHGDEIRLHDPATGKELRKLPLRGITVAFAPDGRTLVAGGSFITGMPVGKGVSLQGGGRVGVMAATGVKESLLIKGQGIALGLSADGKFLATAWGSRQHLGRYVIENENRHNQVALWELATGKELRLLGEGGATVVAISPDSKKVAAGRLDGTVRILDLAPAGFAAGRRELTPEEFDRHWEALASDIATRGYETIWTLADSGERAVVLLKERLQPVVPAGPRVKQLLANLDNKRFAVREAAFRELKKLGAQIEGELREALKGSPSPEVKTRVQTLLDLWENHPANVEELRQTRALQVLERVGGEQARAALRRLAEGAPGAWLTTEAQAALRRLERRAAPP